MSGISWVVDRDHVHHYFEVFRYEVSVGHHEGSSLSDTFETVSHQDFLAGACHDRVREVFGAAVLAEAIAAVHEIDAGRDESTPQGRLGGSRDRIAAINVDHGLLRLLGDPAAVHGHQCIGNLGDGRTRVVADGAALVADGTTATVEPLGGAGPAVTVDCGGPVEGVLGWRDKFLLKVGHGWLCLGPDGARWDEGRIRAPSFGAELRVTEVHRHEQTLLVSYRWTDPDDGPPGVLRFVPGVGFIDRDE
jgi:hypothetical protein